MVAYVISSVVILLMSSFRTAHTWLWARAAEYGASGLVQILWL